MKQLKKLSEFIASFHLEDAPETVVEAAKSCILDTVSVSMGATDNPLYQNVREEYLCQEGVSAQQSSVWGSNLKLSPRNSAFLNAMAGHTLELDDVHTGSKTHIGTVVVPAAWAVAESLNKSGKELLEAVICGYETMARIGMGFGVSGHRNKGWHVTGTAGTFGAAAACGKLYGFTSQQMTDVFGLAGTQSCATWAFLTDSATNKVLHPARAAASGLESCMLVRAGMKGTSHILDADDGGIFPMMSDQYNYDLVCRDLGNGYEIMNVDKKPYPCCRSTHCAIDAAIALRQMHKIQAEQIDQVIVDTYLVGVKQCGASAGSLKPSLSTEAKFSTPYVSACALINGRIGLNDFLPENIADPQRQNLLSRIHVQENSEYTAQYPEHWGCRMTIFMKDGSKYPLHIEDASGSITSPLSRQQLTEKTFTCCHKYDKLWITTRIHDILNIETAQQLPNLGPLT